jgi:hypothetical protein
MADPVTGHSSCISTTKKDAPFFSKHASLPHTSTPSKPHVLGFCDISQQQASYPVTVKPLPPQARVPLNSLLLSAIPSRGCDFVPQGEFDFEAAQKELTLAEEVVGNDFF